MTLLSNCTSFTVEWPELHDAATKVAGLLAYLDEWAVCFYIRRTLDALFASLRHRAFRGEL